MNYYVRDYDRSYFDQDYDLHSGVIAPAATAGAHTLQKEPRFRDGHGPGKPGRWQLAEGSPGCDDGVVLPNFSDSALGGAPDRGAHETGSADLQFGPVLWLANQSQPAAPTTSRASSNP